MDLFTVDALPDVRSFLSLANGSATFDAPRSTPFTGSDPRFGAAGDWNADGALDVAAQDFSTGDLLVMLGTQDGFFFVQQALPYIGAFTSLDVDGDADLDFAVLAYPPQNVQLWHNDGTGLFASGAMFPSGVLDARLIESGDMDGDGLEDLVVSGQGEHLRVLRADGHGGFPFAGLVPQLTGGAAVDMSLGDIDGDGDLDVCLATSPYQNIGLLRNLGNGVFASVSILDFGENANTSALGDVDGDGDLDWLLSGANEGQPAARIYLNDGGGGFTPLPDLTVPNAALAACFLDADQDGDLDVAVGDREDELIQIFRND